MVNCQPIFNPKNSCNLKTTVNIQNSIGAGIGRCGTLTDGGLGNNEYSADTALDTCCVLVILFVVLGGPTEESGTRIRLEMMQQCTELLPSMHQ